MPNWLSPFKPYSDLEIQQYVAAKGTMVKNQVDIVVLIADGDPFLPGFKTKAGTQFQEECLQMIEEGGFEIRLAIRGPFGEPREFKHVRIAQERGDRGGRVLRASSANDGFLVGREAGTLVQERSDLALELADRPVSVKTFRFVKGPFERIVDTDQFDEMRPGEP